MLSEPYSSCIHDPSNFKWNKTLIDHILNSSRVYSQKECLELCFNLFYIQMNPCNCSESKLDNTMEICLFNKPWHSETWNCTRQFRIKFIKEIFNQKCFEYCPLECDSISYVASEYSISYLSSGNISLLDKLPFGKKFENYFQVEKKFFSFVVYYEDLKYTEISQSSKMEFVDLGKIIDLFFCKLQL